MPQKARPRFDGDQWTIWRDGRRHYLCKGAANESLAWKLAEQLGALPPDVDKPPRSVTQATDLWLRQRGGQWHEWILAPFMRFGARTLLARVHPEYLDDYKLYLEKTGYRRVITRGTGDAKRKDTLEKPYSASAMRRQLSLAHRVLRWAHVRGFMLQQPPELPALPQPSEVDRSLTKEQLAAIFEHVPQRAGDVLRFIAVTGCRPAEACELTHEEIRGSLCELRRGKTFARTGKPRVLYLSPAALELVARQLKSQKRRKNTPPPTGPVFTNRMGSPYQPRGLRTILRRAGIKAKVGITGPYQLRHSFAQHALDKLTLDEVGELLGHVAGSRATRTYARIRGERALAAAQSLDALVSPDPRQRPGAAKARAKQPRRTDAPPTPRETAKPRRARAG